MATATTKHPGTLRPAPDPSTQQCLWNHLADGGDIDDAAATIGAIAGLGPKEPPTGPQFAELATEFLDRVGNQGWSWRCAFDDSGRDASWAEPYRAVLRHYRTTAEGSTLPTIARIWGATYNDAAPVIVDQDNLRIWIVDDDVCRELSDTDPLQRLIRAVELLLT